MGKVHSEDDIREVCRAVLERNGSEGFTRGAVQKALRERARLAGSEAEGVTNEVVGRVMREIRDELRNGRVAAQARATAAEAIALPDALGALLARCLNDIELACREQFALERERCATEVRQRVEATEQEAVGKRLVLEADLLVLQGESEGLAAELDAARARNDECDARILELASQLQGAEVRAAELVQSLEERAAAMSTLHVVTTERAAAFEADVRRARDALLTEAHRAHAAELHAAEAVTALSRLQERFAVLASECDRWREAAARQEARAAEAERAQSEGRGRLAAVEAECARLREGIARGSEARDKSPAEERSPAKAGKR